MAFYDLKQKTVHLWTIDLDTTKSIVSKFRQYLSTDECAKSDRFYFEHDRMHYIVCRGALRQLSAAYLSVSPHDITFSYGKYGKPYLTLTFDLFHSLSFNVSHSGSLAVIAFAKDQNIGVDIEQIRKDMDTLSIAERFFSFAERAQIKMLPNHLQQEAFFTCWTQKEAFIKARGDGLSFPLKDFDVSVDPREAPQLLAVRCGLEEIPLWSMRRLTPAPNYIGALAIEGYIDTVNLYKFRFESNDLNNKILPTASH